MGRTKTPAERFATMPADKHGVRSGYTYWGCRCDACTRADLAYRRPTSDRGPIQDTAGYRYWGCRCDACAFANRTVARQRRDGRRGPAPEGPTVTRRYQYRIDATPAVRTALMRVFGGCRFIHNAYITMARDAFDGGNAHPTLGEATKALITQGRANPDTPWLKELPTIALRGALKDAVQAYENFFSSVTGIRQGRSVGRPVFRRRHAHQTARFYEAGFPRRSYPAHNAGVRTGKSCASRWRASTPAPPTCDVTTPANSSPD